MKGYGLFMLVALLLGGCSTSKDEMLPPGDSTMLDMWQNKASSARTTTETRSVLRRGLTIRIWQPVSHWKRAIPAMLTMKSSSFSRACPIRIW
ncbi:putative lipoprotein [Klebsiella variicola]|nr:putative lipoprotein [Klebsiella variicola]